MATAFHAADFGFRPIRPEEALEEGDEDMDVGADTRDPGEVVSVNAEAAMETAGDEDLCFADAETLPDATGFGARQREINEKEHGKYLEQTERSFPGPFLGTTLRELCDSYADVAAQSATPTDVWADVVTTLRERERTACATVLDPATARHMKYRATLIEWILEVCADFGFGPTTADLAVQYMVRDARDSSVCARSDRGTRYFPHPIRADRRPPRPARDDFTLAGRVLTLFAHRVSRSRPLPARRTAF
jgi:hypothetical protein